MAIGVSISVDDRKARDTIGRILSNHPKMGNQMVWNMTQQYAKGIKMTAGNAFSYPRPYLSKTIKPKKVEEGQYAVMMARYAWLVDRGRKPGPVADTGILRNWAKKAGIPYPVLRRSIAKKGTRPRPFILNGIEYGRSLARPALKKTVNRFISSKGRITA